MRLFLRVLLSYLNMYQFLKTRHVSESGCVYFFYQANMIRKKTYFVVP
jgi:hypothetical protein